MINLKKIQILIETQKALPQVKVVRIKVTGNC
jgi:hypothetical protein